MRVGPWESWRDSRPRELDCWVSVAGAERDVEKPAVGEGSCYQRKDSGKDRMHLYKMFGSGWTLHRSVRNAKVVMGGGVNAMRSCSVMRDLGIWQEINQSELPRVWPGIAALLLYIQ